MLRFTWRRCSCRYQNSSMFLLKTYGYKNNYVYYEGEGEYRIDLNSKLLTTLFDLA